MAVDNRKMETRGEIIRRILCLIDVMANQRLAKETSQIADLVNDQMRRKYSHRTILRDLIAMHEQGLVDRVHGRSRGCPSNWKLNLARTENQQRAAIRIAQ